MCASVCPCLYRHSGLWCDSQRLLPAKAPHPCPGEAAKCRQRGSGEVQAAPAMEGGLPTLSPHGCHG